MREDKNTKDDHRTIKAQSGTNKKDREWFNKTDASCSGLATELLELDIRLERVVTLSIFHVTYSFDGVLKFPTPLCLTGVSPCPGCDPASLPDPQSEPQRHLSDQLQGRVQVKRRSRGVPETSQVPGGHHLHGEWRRHQGQRHLLSDLHPFVR